MEYTLSNISEYKKRLEKERLPFGETAAVLSERLRRMDADIHAFAHLDPKAVSSRAEKLQSSGKKGRLWGEPVAIKSNICVKGELATCASHILEGFRPPYNATVIEKLEDEGALIVSGANMDEFAFGSSCETSFYGPTRNPWDRARTPGGSSGGSAAAVAAGSVCAALGSDTGGSIRQPAAMCGVVGMKPTYGRVSRYGLIAFASSLDQIGPITRNVEDSALMLEIISGHDKKDSTSVENDVPRYTEHLGKDIKGLRIGLPAEYSMGGVSREVTERVNEAIKVLRSLGAETVDISLPHTKYAVACYYIIGPAEASSNLARFDGVHYGYRSKNAGDMIGMYTETRSEGFGPEAKRRILLGTYALSSGYYDAYYLKAQKVRTRITDDFRKAFEKCDCIVTPTAPTTAFKIGERINDPLTMYMSDVFTIPANLAGIPAMSVPCGMGENNMPVGLQFMAAPFREDMIIKIAHAFERNTSHHKVSAGEIGKK